MRQPDDINTPAPFNDTGELWNDDDAKVVRPIRYLTPLDETQAPEQIVARRPRVLRDFAAVPEDLPVDRVYDGSVHVARETLVGSFAAVRAAKILQQYTIGFWSDAGIIETLTESQASDPSADDVATQYENFQTFSYLPASITPSQTEFADLVAPSKRPTNVRNSLSAMGLKVSNVNVDNVAVFQDTANVGQTLPDPIPFANSLSTFCSLPVTL